MGESPQLFPVLECSKMIRAWFCHSSLTLTLAPQVHKNIRSESVVFLPARSGTGAGPSTSTPQHLDFEKPLLTGLERARADDPAIDGHGGYDYYDGDRERSKRAKNILLDIYHHPDKRNDQFRRYQRRYGKLSPDFFTIQRLDWLSRQLFAGQIFTALAACCLVSFFD